MEVLRKSALTPIGSPHKMLTDKIFQGYFFPKDTLVISNIDSCLQDPQCWGEDAENFRPERFLSEDGTKVVFNDALIPFSVGKRRCLGESFAMETLFLFITSIFQKYKVSPDPENLKPDLESTGGFTNFPKPFKIVIKEL